MSTTKYNGWQNLPTIQSKEMLAELVAAKENPKSLTFICDTGNGKSNTIKMFMAKKTKHTYLVTLGDTYSLLNLLHELQQQMGLPLYKGARAKHLCLRDISKKVVEVADMIAEFGQVPMIILDETENARLNTLKALKELYDAVIEKCSLVLVGTSQLISSLNKKSEGQSIPQLRRRLKAGIRYITAFNKTRDMKQFFDLYIPNAPDVQDLLIELCDNYGELHDYLDPFLRHCAKKNIAPTEEVFRLYHKIPKLKK